MKVIEERHIHVPINRLSISVPEGEHTEILSNLGSHMWMKALNEDNRENRSDFATTEPLRTSSWWTTFGTFIVTSNFGRTGIKHKMSKMLS